MDTTPLSPEAGPRAGCWFFALPVVLVMLIVGAYGVLFFLGARGRPADGDVVLLDYESCAEALPIVKERVETMGLGDPSFSGTEQGFRVQARLPSEQARAERIPLALAQRGDFQVVDAATGSILAERKHITTALVRLNIVANPSTVVMLDDEGAAAINAFRKAEPLGAIAVLIDGERVWEHKNEHPLDATRLDVPTTKTTLEEGTAQTAEWAILLDHAMLPCETSLRSSHVVEPAP